MFKKIQIEISPFHKDRQKLFSLHKTIEGVKDQTPKTIWDLEKLKLRTRNGEDHDEGM